MRGIVSGRLFAVAVSIVALCLPAAALADEPEDPPRKAREGGILTSEEILSVLAVGVDLLIVRPAGVVATAVGFGLFLPVALLSMADYPDSVQESWELFVVEPAKGVYDRPLGDL